MSTLTIWGAKELTGGATGALDAINGASLTDGDGAIVFTTSGLRLYVLDEDSAETESSPAIIKPDTNAGDKRWLNIFTVSAAEIDREEQTATDGQTLFTLSSIIYATNTNALLVFLNGELVPSSSVTETSTTSVTLATPCAEGDVVEFMASTTLAFADIQTATNAAQAAQAAAEAAQAQCDADVIATAADVVSTNADAVSTAADAAAAAQSAIDAAAAVCGVKVSSDDTTPGDLETKLLAGNGITMTTGNPGGAETRTVALDFASQAEAQAGTSTVDAMSPARTKDAVDYRTECLIVACGAEDGAVAAGTGIVTFRMPYAMTLTAVRASLVTASTSGAVTIDINESGTTILSTKLTLDQDEKTSTTAATAAVISDAALADDAEMTIDVDGAGTDAEGLKVTLIGRRA